MNAANVALVAQAVASGVMCGIIWFVQLVHYPLLAMVTGEAGAAYADSNRLRTAWVVLGAGAATTAGCKSVVMRSSGCSRLGSCGSGAGMPGAGIRRPVRGAQVAGPDGDVRDRRRP